MIDRKNFVIIYKNWDKIKSMSDTHAFLWVEALNEKKRML